jgi:hypothetical protein
MSQSHAVDGAGVALALTTSQRGVTLLPATTPLTRLNYFDGKFLRAADLAREQGYLRELAALGNQGGGAGVVHGFSVALRGTALQLEAGLAIDRDGHVLLLPETRLVDVGQLIEASRETSRASRARSAESSSEFRTCTVELAPPGTGTGIPATELYLLTLCRTEELCGQEDVLGGLCEDACATATGRPFRVEGVVLRAQPLRLPAIKASQSVAFGPEHLRSLVASAYYESERRAEGGGRLISGEGLRADEWCGGAGHRGGCEVPLGVLARSGEGVVFLDAWAARRERMEPHPRRHWAFAMAMRPWDVYLAQVLQFQCQLHELLEREHEPKAQETRAPHQQVLAATAAYLEGLEKQTARQPGVRSLSLADLPGGATALAHLRDRLQGVLAQAVVPDARMLIRGGIVELPPAGYLPVRRGVPVNDQVRAWMGDGVDLRFCAVRPDYVPHALEEAQHMDRISLLEGLDDPARRPQVDVLVPNGEVLDAEAGGEGRAYGARVQLSATNLGAVMAYDGVARSERLGAGGGAFHFAGAGSNKGSLPDLAERLLDLTKNKFVVEGNLEGKAIPTVADSTPFRTRIASLSRNARRLVSANQFRLSQLDGPGGARPLDRSEFLGSTPGRVDAAWLTCRTTRALSTLTEADGQTTVSGRLLLTVSHKQLTALDLSVSGSFSLLQARLGEGRRLEGILPVTLAVSWLSADAATESRRTQGYRLDLLAQLLYDGDDEGGSVVTALSVQGPPTIPLVRFRTTWEGFGRSLRFELLSNASGVDDQTPPKLTLLARGTFRANADVLAEDDERHDLAAKALDLVQTALLSEPAFESTARGLLFAPPVAGAPTLQVKAVEDWVLFHRRRTKTCEPLAERPAGEPPRRYRVFEITVPDLMQAAELYRRVQLADERTQDLVSKALASGKDPTLVVAFDGGSDAVAPAVAAALAADWPGFEPGRVLAYALVARPNATDRLLEQRRLGRVLSAISTLTDTRHVVEQVLPSVPSGWADPTTDGSMLFITVAPPAERHRVVAGMLEDGAWIQFAKALGEAKVEDVPELYKRFGLQELDDTDFQGGTAAFLDKEDDGLRAAWGASPLDGTTLDFAAVWPATRENPLPPDEMNRRRKQTAAIEAAIFKVPAQELLDVPGGIAPSALPPGADGKTCDAVTFLIVVRPTKVLVALMRGDNPVGQVLITQSSEGKLLGDLTELRKFADRVRNVQAAFTARLETDLAPGSKERTEALVERLMKEGLPQPGQVDNSVQLSPLAKSMRGEAAEVLFLVIG